MIVQQQIFTVGTTPASDTVYIRNNVENTTFDATVQTLVTGTVNYTIEVNLGLVDDNPQDYIYSSTFGQVIPDPNGWVPYSTDLTNQTGNVIIDAPYTFNFMRVTANSGTAGATVTLKYLQQGTR